MRSPPFSFHFVVTVSGGWAVGPDFRAPREQPPQQYVQGSSATRTESATLPLSEEQTFLGGEDAPAAWWSARGSSAPDGLIARTLAANQSVKAMDAAAESAARVNLDMTRMQLEFGGHQLLRPARGGAKLREFGDRARASTDRAAIRYRRVFSGNGGQPGVDVHAICEMSHQSEAVCALCRLGPNGLQGHADLVPRLETVNGRIRSRVWLAFTCSARSSCWARHRLAKAVYEWVPVC